MDHFAEAVSNADLTHQFREKAHVHATLAMAEQFQIANLIRFYEATASPAVRAVLLPLIAARLGVTLVSDDPGKGPG